MSDRWDGEFLRRPITADHPCGENLEDTDLLASFDTYAVFGQSTPLDAPPAPGEKRVAKPAESPVWREIESHAVEALGRSKDLRLLALLGTALLRTEGLLAFTDTLKAASEWLEAYWPETYPLVDEDAILRRNALNCFADPMAVIEPMRRVPLVSSRQHGRYSLRDVEIATGQVPAGPRDTPVSENQINAAFQETPVEALQLLHEGVTGAIQTLQRIDTKMRLEGGSEAAPTFELLSTQLAKIARVLRAQLASRSDVAVAPPTSPDDARGREGPPVPSGAIGSRQEAIRALDAVAEFFRRNEPSSPIPLLVDRAKRLVAKDFLEVLQDIAPDALAQARMAGGVRAEE